MKQASGSSKAMEREKAAIENTTQGYDSTVKSRHISAKPDGDTSGGPGANNEKGIRPPQPEQTQRKR